MVVKSEVVVVVEVVASSRIRFKWLVAILKITKK